MKLASNTNQTVIEDEPVRRSPVSSNGTFAEDRTVLRLVSNTKQTVVENDES